MIKPLLLAIGVTLCAMPAHAAQVVLAWDASVSDATHPTPTGYQVRWGTATGAYTGSLDVGLALTAAVTNLAPDTKYFFVVVAFANLAVSGPSNEVSGTTAADVDTACVYPLGAKSIGIFVTKLTTTGNAHAGSKARLDFQVGSSSPVTRVSVLGNGVELVAIMAGSDLTSLAGQWFTVPSASTATTFALSVHAENLYGCRQDRATTFTVSSE